MSIQTDWSLKTRGSLELKATTEKTWRVSPLSREMNSSSWCSSRPGRGGGGFQRAGMEPSSGGTTFCQLPANYNFTVWFHDGFRPVICESWLGRWSFLDLNVVLINTLECRRKAGGLAHKNKNLYNTVEKIVMSVCESLELLPLSMVLLSVSRSRLVL